MDKVIDGVFYTNLKQIYNPKGDVFHAMKQSDVGFNGFGEVYFSSIHYGDIKPWKKHLHMTLNLVVPIGCIRFVIYDDREKSPTKGLFNEFTLSPEKYCRLTVPPGVWMAFQGVGRELNLLLNVANLEHDPNEMVRIDLEEIKYGW